ncbi:pyruvate dehydrogenase E1 component subunit alpha, mitochondrial-like [Coccinella septempunctata]|uniref:pyruvate dehydrogenase E1 component subunit alpha, mitochondrial-like n=1 Tax=Coccinella septempunctata TaxID=41139 RepID=UPI001D099CFA|nr:pyruvate dehydrogenase E1 component subunit alpha, mitochondrial-like [Coccinella septempunctata]
MYNRLRLLLRGIPHVNIKFSAKESTEATIQLESQFALHNLQAGPSESVKLKKEDGLHYLKDMDAIRRFENSCAQMYREKVIRGFCHLYAGQEAVGVGIFAAMRPQDICITSYRAHGMAYLMGATIEEVLCELTGRASGIARGKGGSMHMYAPRMYGGNGIVGSHIPVGTGLAFALKYSGKDAASITMYGDGAANQGQCFESFNLAKLFNLPVVYVVENNHFGLGTYYKRVAANPKFYTRCEYIPGLFVDGMDVLAVRESMRYAIDFVSKGNGPIIVECMTYRYYGHSMSDPGTSYRKREEIEETREKRDCLKKLKKYLIDSKLSTAEEIKAVEKEGKKRVEKATEFSKKDKFPPVSELYTDVYVKALEPIRNVLPYNPLPHLNTKK